VRLLDTIGRWLGRVEVVLAGADETLRDGEDALAAGEAMRARALAHTVLERLPGSPFGLALLADACDMAGLDAELALTLEELAGRLASSSDVWVRLGHARQKTGTPLEEVRDAFVRGLAVADAGSESRRDALLALADLDLAQGDGARAELWLERVAENRNPLVALRRAEARLLVPDLAGARAAIASVESDPTDARAAMTRGRIFALAGDAHAFTALVRAYVLEADGASELLSSTLAWVPADDATRARVRMIVEERGESSLARWRAAFARADGRRDEAREALRDALASGDRSAARPLLDAAVDDHDHAALAYALAALDDASGQGSGSGDAALDAVVADARRLPDAAMLADKTRLAEALDRLQAIETERVLPWAEAMKKEIMGALVPPSGLPAEWAPLLARLDAHARALHDLESTSRIAELAAERRRPVRVAIVGEFNAGKSTFINALIGAEIAPTGVLPTTATLHHLRYAPDPIARVVFEPGHAPPERIVPVTELRATLKAIADDPIRRVEILLPIPSLTRVEILDTPGFNAPDARHARAARGAFEEADAVIWLLDAGQALKQTERVILDEAKAQRIPVQMLVNKADRFGEADLAKVMTMVLESMKEIGLESWSPPLPLSARLALAGKLGDEAALAKSGWGPVEELLDQQIVARSEELKERALRRRGARVVEQLAARAASLADDERGAADRVSRRSQIIAQATAKLDREADDAAKRLAAILGPAAEAWQKDLEVVVTGRDREAAAADPVLLRYRVERALARFGPTLAEGLSKLAPGTGLTPADLVPLTRALVRPLGFASGPAGAPAVIPLARAAVATLIEHLGLLAVPPPRRAIATGLQSELLALKEALS
jgi:cellulose synthase operon protein C